MFIFGLFFSCDVLLTKHSAFRLLSLIYHRKTGLTYLNVTQASGNDGVSGASLEPNPPPPPEGRPILGYRGAAEVRKTLTLLGKNNSTIHTLFTATSSIVLPCLRQRTERRKCTTSCLKPYNGNCYRANSLYMKSLLLNTWSTNNSTCSKSNQSSPLPPSLPCRNSFTGCRATMVAVNFYFSLPNSFFS